jgi:copper(I)-binding protein
MFKKLIFGMFAVLLTAACADVSLNSHVPIATDVVVRANEGMEDAMDGAFMTAAFMTLTNDSDHDMTLVGAKSDVAPMMQIHEVVNGVMQEKVGGLVIKARTSEMLKPGGNHVMLMGMTEPLKAGEEVTLTLLFDDGSELEVTGPVKAVNLEQEHYHSGEPSPSMSGM